MEVDSEAVKLVNTILVMAGRKRADLVRVYRQDARPVVEFLIDGAWQEELSPSLSVHAAIVRRLAIMASLPVYGRGESSEGTIFLMHGSQRLAFAVFVRGHGEQLEAELRALDVASLRWPPIG